MITKKLSSVFLCVFSVFVSVFSHCFSLWCWSHHHMFMDAFSYSWTVELMWDREWVTWEYCAELMLSMAFSQFVLVYVIARWISHTQQKSCQKKSLVFYDRLRFVPRFVSKMNHHQMNTMYYYYPRYLI